MHEQWRNIHNEWQYRRVNEVKAGVVITEYQFRILKKIKPEKAWEFIKEFLQSNAVQMMVVTLEKGHFQGKKAYHKTTVLSLDQLTTDLLEQYNYYGVFMRVIGNMDHKKLMVQARLYPNHFDVYMSAEGDCVDFLSLFSQVDTEMDGI